MAARYRRPLLLRCSNLCLGKGLICVACYLGGRGFCGGVNSRLYIGGRVTISHLRLPGYGGRHALGRIRRFGCVEAQGLISHRLSDKFGEIMGSVQGSKAGYPGRIRKVPLILGDADEIFPDFDNPRFVSPAQPRGAWLGIRVAL